MLVDERRHRIAQVVVARKVATVSELSKQFDVSPITVRSDLEALERQGLLKRNHGGAVAPQILRFSPAFQQKTSVHIREKQKIAQRATELIEDGDRIIIDSGSTALLLARRLRHRRLTVLVNSVYTMNELAGMPYIDLIAVGGNLYEPGMTFVGPWAEAILDKMHMDKVFLGVNGVAAKGVSVNNIQEAAIKAKMITASSKVIVLADASKIGVDSFAYLASLKDVDTLVTNSNIDSQLLEELAKSGTEVIVV
jgi:DeoR/GlpR family transcriptional regulator of sugar metabolism